MHKKKDEDIREITGQEIKNKGNLIKERNSKGVKGVEGK